MNAALFFDLEAIRSGVITSEEIADLPGRGASSGQTNP